MFNGRNQQLTHSAQVGRGRVKPPGNSGRRRPFDFDYPRLTAVKFQHQVHLGPIAGPEKTGLRGRCRIDKLFNHKAFPARTRHRMAQYRIEALQRMPFGSKAKQYLGERLLGKKVVALITKQDRYGRHIATLLHAGEDINLQLIQAGLAWHFTKYAREQTDESAARYLNAEQIARAQSVGLRQANNPQPPWDWRATRKQKYSEAKCAASPIGICASSY